MRGCLEARSFISIGNTDINDSFSVVLGSDMLQSTDERYAPLLHKSYGAEMRTFRSYTLYYDGLLKIHVIPILVWFVLTDAMCKHKW